MYKIIHYNHRITGSWLWTSTSFSGFTFRIAQSQAFEIRRWISTVKFVNAVSPFSFHSFITYMYSLKSNIWKSNAILIIMVSLVLKEKGFLYLCLSPVEFWNRNISKMGKLSKQLKYSVFISDIWKERLFTEWNEL